jgi:DNA-binding NtrC family response regulator
VDDEREFVEALSERLVIRDYDVTISFSGEDAIDKVKNDFYDVVILDVAMPGKDGIETLREIKSIKPLTEVIILTGHGVMETAVDGKRLGAYDSLLKPCETNELISKINQAYKQKEKRRENSVGISK